MRSRAAFTVLEMATVIVIIAILAVLLLPVFAKVHTRAQRVQCISNLRNLHVAAAQYVQDNNEWPQIEFGSDEGDDTAFAQEWIAALAPYHLTKKSWICPAIQNALGKPDYNSPGNERVDYLGMPFDDKPMTPYQWPRQPWFVETMAIHDSSQLIIFTDGSISDYKTLLSEGKH